MPINGRSARQGVRKKSEDVLGKLFERRKINNNGLWEHQNTDTGKKMTTCTQMDGQ